MLAFVALKFVMEVRAVGILDFLPELEILGCIMSSITVPIVCQLSSAALAVGWVCSDSYDDNFLWKLVTQ